MVHSFTTCLHTKTLLRKRKFTEYRCHNLQEVLKSSQNKKHHYLKTILIAKGTDCNTKLNVIVLRIIHNDRSFRNLMQHEMCICNLWHGDTVMTNFTHSGVRTFLKTEALGNLNTFHYQFCVTQFFLRDCTLWTLLSDIFYEKTVHLEPPIEIRACQV
jgi:hypothetical protein